MEILWYKTNGFATGNCFFAACPHLFREMPDLLQQRPVMEKEGRAAALSTTGKPEEFL